MVSWKIKQMSPTERGKGGVENSGEGKTYHKTPPRKRSWTTPLMVPFPPPPPVCSCPVIFLRGNGHRPAAKLVLEGALCSTFSASKSHNRFAPPAHGEKEYTVYTTTVETLLSRSVARPRGHRAKKAMVYAIFLGKKGKGYTP